MKRILIVDDDRHAADALQEILSAQGWQVNTALTPEQAIRIFDRESFDLVISDINLDAPQTGLDLLKEFRQHCPVILITGFGTLDTVVKATQEGAWDLISKPFKVREVIDAVERVLAQRPAENTDPTAEALALPMEQTGMVGRSPAMLKLYKEIARVASRFA